jgi:hypothetical protein
MTLGYQLPCIAMPVFTLQRRAWNQPTNAAIKWRNRMFRVYGENNQLPQLGFADIYFKDHTTMPWYFTPAEQVVTARSATSYDLGCINFFDPEFFGMLTAVNATPNTETDFDKFAVTREQRLLVSKALGK